MENNPEIILIRKVMNGEADSFNLLINNYRGKLFGYLLRFSGDKVTAEDLFQETLIKAWTGFKRYNEKNRFSSWLFTIAHNVALDFLRKNKNVFHSIYEKEVSGLQSNDDIIKTVEEKEIKNMINGLVMTLPEKQKNVFLLRQHGELTFREISKITGEPINTVISHMNYAVKKIKKALQAGNAL